MTVDTKAEELINSIICVVDVNSESIFIGIKGNNIDVGFMTLEYPRMMIYNQTKREYDYSVSVDNISDHDAYASFNIASIDRLYKPKPEVIDQYIREISGVDANDFQVATNTIQ